MDDLTLLTKAGKLKTKHWVGSLCEKIERGKKNYRKLGYTLHVRRRWKT